MPTASVTALSDSARGVASRRNDDLKLSVRDLGLFAAAYCTFKLHISLEGPSPRWQPRLSSNYTTGVFGHGSNTDAVQTVQNRGSWVDMCWSFTWAVWRRLPLPCERRHAEVLGMLLRCHQCQHTRCLSRTRVQ